MKHVTSARLSFRTGGKVSKAVRDQELIHLPEIDGRRRHQYFPNQDFERIGCSYAQVLLILIRVLMHVLGFWVDKYFECSCM